MARNQKNPACRQKNLLVPTEICVCYERYLGIKTGEEPTKAQVMEINELMLDQIECFIRRQKIELTSEDYMLIAKEKHEQEMKFAAKSAKALSKKSASDKSTK